MRFLLRWSAALCLLLGATAIGAAQGSYPDRPVKFIVAFPPGGDELHRPVRIGALTGL